MPPNLVSGQSPATLPTRHAGIYANSLLHQILRTAQLAVWIAWDNPLEVISVDGGWQDSGPFGLDEAQFAPGALWLENVYPADRARLRGHLDASKSTRAGKPIDYRLIVGEGELLWVRHWMLHETLEGGRRQFRGMIMAIPEEKHLEWECLRVSERECNRIGQELHDDLCQVLAGLGFMMRCLGLRARTIDPALAAEVEEVNAQIAGATDRVRSMAHGLFPAQLKHATLRDALTALAAEARTRFRIQLVLTVPAELPPHTPEQIIHVYRIVQETVSNAVRHGNASSVTINVAERDGTMRMTIENNGKGLPTGSARPEGIGMHVMEYRARALGGTLSFRTLAPRSVAVRLAYPISHVAGVGRTKSPNKP